MIPELYARDLITHCARFTSPPSWISERTVYKICQKIGNRLEWSIRRTNVTRYVNEAQFEAVHGFGPAVLAIARPSDQSIHLGPRVNAQNFEKVFGHELVHIALFQKYKDSIPEWLVEGFANYFSDRIHVDYSWLLKQNLPKISSLSHPFLSTELDHQVHYMASTAFMQMLDEKCDLKDLIQLSVGKKLVTYLHNTCEIKDLDQEFQAWLKKKASTAKASPQTKTQ